MIIIINTFYSVSWVKWTLYYILSYLTFLCNIFICCVFTQGSSATRPLDLKHASSDTKSCVLLTILCCFWSDNGWKPSSALELILCFLWSGFKRWTSEEQKWSPFACFSYDSIRKSVREGPSTPRAGTRIITMIPFSSTLSRLTWQRESGKKEPLVFVYEMS